MRYTSRALLCVTLLVGVYVLAFTVIVALAATAVLSVRFGLSAYVMVKLGVPLAFVAYVVLRAALRRPARVDPGGLLMTEEDQPGLWAEARRLAADVGTRPPDEIRLVAEANAAVSEDSRLLGLRGGTRRLYVGAPLLLAMSPLELRAVLAHEMGHYSARHTALAPVTYRGLEAVGRVCADLGSDTLFGRAFSAYGRLYARAAHAVGRRQELEADRFAVAAAGSKATAAALETLLPLEAAWRTYLSRYAPLGADEGLWPAPLFERFNDFLSDPEILSDLARFADEHVEPPVSPYDTHPPMSERLARLGTCDGPAAVPSAPDLLAEPASTLAALERLVFDGSDRKPGDWQAVESSALAARTAGGAGELGRLVTAADRRAGSIRRAVDFLVRPLRPGLIAEAPLEEEQRIVAQLVGDAMAVALVASGAARFAPTWSRPRRLQTPAGEDVDPWLAASDATGRAAGPLLDWAASHGVDVDAPLPAPPASDPPALGGRARLLGVVGPVLVGPFILRRWRVLAVGTEGMALLKVTVGEMYALSFSRSAGRAAWRSTSERIVRRVAALPPEGLAQRRATRFAAWTDITDVVVEVRRRPPKVVVRLVDGSRIVTKLDQPTRLGDPFGALERILGDRFTRQ